MRGFALPGSGCGILTLELRDRCLRGGRGEERLCLLGWWDKHKHKSKRNRDIDMVEALSEVLHPAGKRTGLGPRDAATYELTKHLQIKPKSSLQPWAPSLAHGQDSGEDIV